MTPNGSTATTPTNRNTPVHGRHHTIASTPSPPKIAAISSGEVAATSTPIASAAASARPTGRTARGSRASVWR